MKCPVRVKISILWHMGQNKSGKVIQPMLSLPGVSRSSAMISSAKVHPFTGKLANPLLRESGNLICLAHESLLQPLPEH